MCLEQLMYELWEQEIINELKDLLTEALFHEIDM